jgi:uncharacterized Zn-finger protein
MANVHEHLEHEMTKVNKTPHQTYPKKQHRFQCDICGRSYVMNCQLKYHIAEVHEKLKPFKCSTCEKGFARGFELKRHVLVIHDKAKTFQC